MTIRLGIRTPSSTINPTVVHEQANGLFGELVVSDYDGIRTMWCGLLCHGSVYIEPTFQFGTRCLSPGPIPEAAYVIGWLVAALKNPQGTILMVGLGPGSGVTTLLYNFPELSVVVVEIDSDVIRLCRSHFPMVDHYVEQGRLKIVNADIKYYVKYNPCARWSSILMDAYQTDTTLHCPRQLLEDLRPHSDSLWLNLLDSLGGPRVRALKSLLKQTGWDLGTVMPVSSFWAEAEFHSGNILVGTDVISPSKALKFKPFADILHERAVTARGVYSTMITRSISLDSA